MTRYRSLPWKRNIRKIPSLMRSQLEAAPTLSFIAGVVKTISRDDLLHHRMNHLRIGVAGELLSFPNSILPPANMGAYSRRNREGWEEVRKDLPIMSQTRTIETPNFGDWSNGSHEIDITQDVYQRDYFEPPEIEILIEKLLDGVDESVVLKFTANLALDRGSDQFEADLLFTLNLLQENLGTTGILPRSAVAAELLETINLQWEIFPPGTAEETAARLSSNSPHLSDAQRKTLEDRIKLFQELNPKQYLRGVGGMTHYIGAMFAGDLVVFENVRRGNALYVLYGDWKDVSKRSRSELLRAGDAVFNRFVHTTGWAERFTEHLIEELQKRGIEDRPLFRKRSA